MNDSLRAKFSLLTFFPTLNTSPTPSFMFFLACFVSSVKTGGATARDEDEEEEEEEEPSDI